MIIVIDQASAVPPFEQLRQQLTTMILAGTLPAGHRLPPVRQLASDLGLANGTVARTYRELESEGLVTTNGRHGTQVRATAEASSEERRARLREAAQLFARTAQQLGATPAEIVAATSAAGLYSPAPLSDLG
ncbi:MAG: GntR family transcriptional regulator [Ilumatobacteraceae bacterium]